MLSQDVSQILLLKLEVPLCDIFKCAGKNCLSSDVKKYLKAQYYIKDNPVLNNSSFNSEKNEENNSYSGVSGRKLEVRLYDVLKNSNKELDLSSFINNKTLKRKQNFTTDTKKASLKINSESERSSEVEITSGSESSSKSEIDSDWEKSSDIESVYGDEKDDDYNPTKERKQTKKKPLAKKITSKSESVSENEMDSDSESSSRSEMDFISDNSSKSESETTSSKKRNKKKKIIKIKKPLAKENRKLTEYEKLIQKGREEKMAFLKSLQIDEIKEDIKETVSKLKSERKPSKIDWKNLLPERKKSVRAVKGVNLSEEYITNRAYSEASKEQERIRTQRIKVKTIRTRRRGKIDSDSEEDSDDKSNLLMVDFLIAALNDERYGNFLKWGGKSHSSFKIQWRTTNNLLFQDYDKLKGRYHPEAPGYRRKSMERFYAAMKKHKFIREIRLRQKNTFAYEISLDRKKMEKETYKRLESLISKRFTCEVCGLVFNKAYLLTHHRSMLHTAESPVSCEICGRFFIKDKLIEHRMIDHAVPFGHLSGTSGQSNATPGKTVLYLLKLPTNATNTNEADKIGQPPKSEPNSTSSTSTNITSASLVPQATACHDLGHSAGTSSKSNEMPANMLFVLKPPTDSTKTNEPIEMEQPSMSESNPTTSACANLTSVSPTTPTLPV